MLACAIVSVVFVLFVVFAMFVRKKSLHRHAAAGKLDGMDESLLLEEFGVPVRRAPDPDAAPGSPRDILEFEIPGENKVLVFVDSSTRRVTGSTVGPIRGQQTSEQ